MVKHHNLSINDFADIFGTTAAGIPNICKKIIKDSDFRYVILTGKEREEVFLRVFRILLSDSLKVCGPHRKKDWEKGWTENLDNFVQNKFKLEELIPKFVRKKEVVRFRGGYILPIDANFETNFVKVLRYYIFTKYFSNVSKVFEFGCGTGLNLIAVSDLFPEMKLFGLDWSKASCKIVNELSKKQNLNMKGLLFDMFSPDHKIEVDKDSAVFTIGAMEQLGTNYQSFLDFLIKKQPSIIINIEVNYEMLNADSLFDYVAIKYIEKRNYLCGYFEKLHELEKQGKIDIIEYRETVGGLYHNGYPYVVWKPKV
ncbi:MAG: class I SAM-dependent methyltransferase [Syntrophales bacterium]